MLVGFDISPTNTGHGFRGIGSYTYNLQKALSLQKTDLKTEFFNRDENLQKYDLVHYPYFDLFFHTLPVGKTTKKRIVTIHDVVPLLFPDKFPSGIKGFVNLFLQKQALKNVDFVICDSETSKKDIIDKLSVPAGKIKVIYLAAGDDFKKNTDVNTLTTVDKKYNLPNFFCLYVGDVNWNKNVPNLMEAISIHKTPIVLVGRAFTDDSIPQVKDLNLQIKRLSLTNIVQKTGFIPENDLISLYNLATVTVSPSYYEGFGLPVLESMACGTPVICSNNSSLSEIAGSAAFFCDPSDPKDIADKISKTLSLNKKDKKLLSQKCVNQAAKFTWRKTALQTLDLYKKVLVT